MTAIDGVNGFTYIGEQASLNVLKNYFVISTDNILSEVCGTKHGLGYVEVAYSLYDANGAAEGRICGGKIHIENFVAKHDLGDRVLRKNSGPRARE